MMIKELFFRKPWAVHNPLKSWTLKGLSMNELKLVASTLTDAELQLCMVFKDGWTQWKNLCKLEGFEKGQPVVCLDDLPPIPSEAFQTEEVITQVKIVGKEPERLLQDRRHGRHEVRVPVEIIQNSQTFRTETLDISLSGVRFKDSIPDWVAGYFTVLFRKPDKSFEITCALVEDQKENKNCAEVFDTNDEESGLKTYLDWVKSLE